MTIKVFSIGLKGLEGYKVQVEVQMTPGTESMVIEIRACHHPKNVEICRQVDFKESSVESKISAGFFSI
ncbi:hypothetical protein [Bacillus smithii]|uniref:hypothetical protein n=1 Tax=Bacillus smithii TaxID=1479 RepID=UPI00399D4E50